MNWPLASDYQDAVQNPLQCFQDPQLKAGHVVLNRLGLPRVASGMFASVYEFRNGDHRWAVRCFLRPSADQRERYALLSGYLSQVRMPGLVEFAYEAQGIRVRGQWYPIVKMEWIEGVTLHTYISKHVQEPDTLRKLARQWRILLERLRQNHIAHADLQHGNVLVTPGGELRLVDYDGMFVPALRGQASHELGHPNYQHPQRTAQSYDEHLDNFAGLVIYTSLVALIYNPGLWAEFHTGENLIFSAADFKAPQKSRVFEQLYRSSEPLARALSQQLAKACEGAIQKVPDFAQAIANLPDLPMPKPWYVADEPTVPQKPTLAAPKTAPPALDTTPHPLANPNGSSPARPPISKSPTVPSAPAHPNSLPPEDEEDWWKRNQENLEKTQAGKAVVGFLQPLKKIWDEAAAPVPAPPTNVPAHNAAPVPLERGVPRSVSKKRAASPWATCTGVMCLFLCLALLGMGLLAQAVIHTVGHFLSLLPAGL